MWNRAAAKGTPPQPRYGHTCTRLAISRLAVFGGAGQDGELFNDVCVLDTENFVWSTVGSWVGKEPAGRFGHQAFAVGSYEGGVEEQEFVSEGDENSACLVVFGGACLSSAAKDDTKAKVREAWEELEGEGDERRAASI